MRIEQGKQNVSLEILARIGTALDAGIVRLGHPGPTHLRVVGGQPLSGSNSPTGGGSFYSPELARKLAVGSREEIELTPRELQVLAMLARGLNNKEVARELDISVRTVETYRLSIRRKLNIDTSAALVKYALEQGLISI